MNGTGAFTTSRAKGSSMERLKVPEFGLIGRVLRAQFEDAIAQPPSRTLDRRDPTTPRKRAPEVRCLAGRTAEAIGAGM